MEQQLWAQGGQPSRAAVRSYGVNKRALQTSKVRSRASVYTVGAVLTGLKLCSAKACSAAATSTMSTAWYQYPSATRR